MEASVVGPIVNQAAIPIIKQLTYAFEASENVKALGRATDRLWFRKKDVEREIGMDVQRGREVTNAVQHWMNRVQDVKVESDAIKERFNQRSCQCFSGCSLNCFSNYKISKDAYQKCLEVQVLCDEAKFEVLTFEPLPPTVQILPTTSTIPSTNFNYHELADQYINDAGVGIIGILGMGGVGKTHLLKHINNSFSGTSNFDHVIFVTVSKEYSVARVQKKIADRLMLGINEDIESSAYTISNYWRKKKFLLLLDDLWEEVDLAELGIPFPLQTNQKVVLTTRFSSVCRQMETKKEIRVDCLNKEDAWRLFKEKVGAETFSNSSIEQKAKQVCYRVRGLPLALITFGRAMHGQTDISAWDHVIELLEQSRFPQLEAEENITDESLFEILKFSYDMLRDDTLRKCFLVCSLWPEDFEIEKTDLIQLWLGLGIVEELGNSDIYSPGYALIRNLLDTCLLEACQDEDYVKMHDVLRDMALWIARDCGKNMNKWIINDGGGLRDSSVLLPNDIWCKAEYIALRGYAQVLDIPSIVSGTNLKTLRINGCGFERNINSIHNFSCLTFLDLSNSYFINFPKTICQVVNLRYLNLSYNNITNLPMDLKFLINLRYLILRFNHFKETPTDVFSEMKELIILDLIQQELFPFNSSNVLKDIESLKKIKALSINVSDNSEFQRLSNLVHIPVRELSICYEKLDEADNFILITPSFLGESDRQKGLFELSFHCCQGKRQLVFENSKRSINWWFQNLMCLSLSKMLDLENVVYKGVVPQNLFPKLRELYINYCKFIKNFSWIVYLQCLRRLEIQGADPSVHELFTIEQANSSQSAEMEEVRNEAPINKTFPSLERMHLEYLANVKSICPPAITFPSLKGLRVGRDCPIARLPFNKTTVPSNLEFIRGSREWWDSLEWDDDLHKSSVEKFFEEW